MANLRRALFFSVPRILNSSNPTSVSASSIRSYTPHRPILGSFCVSTPQMRRLILIFPMRKAKDVYVIVTGNFRLLYRSKQRGFLELDLVLGKWVEDHIHSIDENGVKALVNVLDLENPDLWKWLTGQEQPPEAVSVNPVFVAVHEKVTKNLNSYASPETRATPGQPWVRGWDDFKKGRDSPITGNQ